VALLLLDDLLLCCDSALETFDEEQYRASLVMLGQHNVFGVTEFWSQRISTSAVQWLASFH
jgi:hypothetical protein